MSAADELRAAAKVERDEWGDETDNYPVASAIHLALADWLDLTVETPAFRAFAEGQSGSHIGKNIRAALAVARAINGGAS